MCDIKSLPIEMHPVVGFAVVSVDSCCDSFREKDISPFPDLSLRQAT